MNSYIRGKTGLKDVIPVDDLEDEILVRSVSLGGTIHRRKEKAIINELKGFINRIFDIDFDSYDDCEFVYPFLNLIITWNRRRQWSFTRKTTPC